MSSIISDLHLKFAQKTWNETFQLVRRCMVKLIPVNAACSHPVIHTLFFIEILTALFSNYPNLSARILDMLLGSFSILLCCK